MIVYTVFSEIDSIPIFQLSLFSLIVFTCKLMQKSKLSDIAIV